MDRYKIIGIVIGLLVCISIFNCSGTEALTAEHTHKHWIINDTVCVVENSDFLGPSILYQLCINGKNSGSKTMHCLSLNKQDVIETLIRRYNSDIGDKAFVFKDNRPKLVYPN